MSKESDSSRQSSTDEESKKPSSNDKDDMSVLGRIIYKTKRLVRQIGDAHILQKKLDRHKSEVSEECETDDGYAKYTLIFRILVALLVTVLLRAAIIAVFFNTDKFTPSSIYYTIQDILYMNSYAEQPPSVLNYSRTDLGSDFELYKSGLVSVGSSEVKIFNATGRVTLTAGDKFSDPTVVTSDRHILVYDLGGSKYSIYNSFKRLRTEQVNGSIAHASMCEDGGFVIVVKTRDYNSEVYRYSADCELLSVYRTNRYVISSSISGDGRYTAVLSASVEGGNKQATLTVLRLNRDEKHAEISLGALDPYSCAFIDDKRIALFCDDRVVVYDREGDIKNEVIYPDAPLSLFSYRYGEGIALLFEQDLVRGINTLILTDEDGDTLYKGTINGNFTDMVLYDENVYLLTNNGFCRFDAKVQASHYTYAENTFGQILVCNSEKILLCTDSEAIYYKVR